MKNYDNLTDGLRTVLMMYNKGYVNHVAFLTSEEKIPALDEKWATELGTQLPPHKRHYRKSKGLANAVAYAMPVIDSDKTQVILMATAEVKNMPDKTEWKRQNWTTRFPEISRFHMLTESRPARNGKPVALTWRINNTDLGEEAKYLNHLVHLGNPRDVDYQSAKIVSFYPMFGGVRRQIRNMLKQSARLWQHKHKSDWPGLNPDELPIMTF